jgi:glucan phosphoethanolaminetransferase (alkaline phosphatase superfamily)
METIAFFIENILFWGFIYVIVFMGCETPAIVFSGFGFFLVYWIFRYVARQKGETKWITLYVANMIVTVMLLVYFLTGKSYTKIMRNSLNSLTKSYPALTPYVKRC